jgi:soluble lytic murein transglycosylase
MQITSTRLRLPAVRSAFSFASTELAFKRTFILTGLVLLAAATAVPAHSQSVAPKADELITQMNRAFKQRDSRKLTQLLPQARGHVLEPWAAYWELRVRLETSATQAEVQEFLSRYPGTYQEDRLRNDWLLLLGQRRDWANFATEYPLFRMNDDREVRCYALLVDQIKGTAVAGAADEVRRLWLSLRDADDGCTTAASRFIGSKETPGMAVADAWRKARMATEANRPRAAAAAVELVAPELANGVAELNASPTKFLTNRTGAPSRSSKELAVLALIKLATSDVEGAAAQLTTKWAPLLSAEERNWVWGVIGKQSAGKLDSEALNHFAKVSKDSDLNDELLAWKARAALRASTTPRWKELLSAVNAMSDEGSKDPTWVYWKARAIKALHSTPEGQAQAQKLFQSIASSRGFYEQLSLEEIGQKITVPAKPMPPSAEEKEAARLNPGLNRALYAIAIGLRTEGVREWNYSTNLAGSKSSATDRGPMSERELLAAAQFACDREVWDRCINTSERTRDAVEWDQRFPLPHREAVLKRSREIGLDPAYVYGLIRQESRFIMDARSGVGAAGLMQVMPATARWTAKKIGLTDFTGDQINDRDTNIAIGTGYLQLVLQDFAGSMPLAAAAYNAGPGRPRAWRNGPSIEAAAWAENVPFAETRDYVKKVLANTTSYAAILTGQPQSLKARLGNVGPRDEAAAPVNKEIP